MLTSAFALLHIQKKQKNKNYFDNDNESHYYPKLFRFYKKG